MKNEQLERVFVLNPNCSEYKGVKRSDIMLISNEDAVKYKLYFERIVNSGFFNLERGCYFSTPSCTGCFFDNVKMCDAHDRKERLKTAKQALRICKILEEQKIDNLTEGITTGALWQCPTCGAQKEPTVEVGDYFEWTEKSNVDNVNLSPCQFRKSAELVSLRSDFYWPLDEDDILNKIKSGELRKLQKGEVIRIEVK